MVELRVQDQADPGGVVVGLVPLPRDLRLRPLADLLEPAGDPLQVLEPLPLDLPLEARVEEPICRPVAFFCYWWSSSIFFAIGGMGLGGLTRTPTRPSPTARTP